ncbi:MAG: 30S ribosomal protein S19 [Nanoarchaeota archaeon]|jgi:small subunit ribosomal protein S19|nr:30S ribosomal protein S19 [Nanoarchaeota archaeon]|tara:strand:- start:29826 stop:30209 length:384 start_codon:yes stop_codon:yes gene_type:complete
MALKEFTYRGKTLEELQKLSLKEFVALLPARSRRSLARGLKPQQKKLLENLKVSKKPVKTHLRNAIIIPEMVGKMIFIYNGKEYTQIKIEPEMIGHYLGEFALTRKSVAHSAPGVGATKSSAAVSVR